METPEIKGKGEIKKALVARGLFPPSVPPVFTSREFAEHCNSSGFLPRKDKRPLTWPEHYSVAEYGLKRRVMRIPHPVSHLTVADVIAKNWAEINGHLGKSKISVSKCKIVGPETDELRDITPAVYITPHWELREQRFLRMFGHSHVLKTDISRCFPSIYTHSIAWALHGKTIAKENRDDKTYLGVDLDHALRRGNDGQTSGIPVGPGTSHVIAEIIMSAIDSRVQENLGFEPNGYRHVDDYFLCFNSYKQAEEALTEIKKAAAAYELAVNDRKTEILRVDDYSEADMWVHRLRELGANRKARKGMDKIRARVYGDWLAGIQKQPEYIKRKQNEERAWLMQFASEAFDFAKAHPSKNVMKYALTRLREVPLPRYKNEAPLREENWDLYENILIRIMTAYPYTADNVAAILCECRDRYPLLETDQKREELSGILSQFVARHALLECHTETAWGLWLAKVLGLKISAEAAEHLQTVQSGVCALLALDCRDKGLIAQDDLDTEFWRHQLLKKEEKSGKLTSQFWLLAYEAPMKGWLGDREILKSEESLFSELEKRDIHFYDDKNRSPPWQPPHKRPFEGHEEQGEYEHDEYIS